MSRTTKGTLALAGMAYDAVKETLPEHARRFSPKKLARHATGGAGFTSPDAFAVARRTMRPI
jgi:hypothetical protein